MQNITLNPGGLIGALGAGAITAGVLATSGAKGELIAKGFVGGVVAGAFAGNYVWSAAFSRRNKSQTDTTVLNDQSLGELSFCPPELWQSPDRRGAWFAPVGRNIGVTVHGDRNGPSPASRAMFAELIERYNDMSHSIADQLRDEYATANPSSRSAPTADVLKPFRLVSIGIAPTRSSEQLEITLTYCPQWRRELNIDVTIRNWNAVSAVGYD